MKRNPQIMSLKGPLASSSASSTRDTTLPPSAIPSAALRLARGHLGWTPTHHFIMKGISGSDDWAQRWKGNSLVIPGTKFLDKFLPSGNFPTMPWKKKHQAAFKHVAKQRSEKAMYKPLVHFISFQQYLYYFN